MSCYHRIIAMLLLGTITTLNAYTLEMIESSPKSQVAQSPFWCEENKSLYYCDLLDTEVCSIQRYCSNDKRVFCATMDRCPNVTFIRPVEGASDRFVVGCRKTVEEIRWDGKSPKVTWIRTVFVAENCSEFETNAFNDGKADQCGRLFFGTRREDACENLDDPTYGNLFRVPADERPVTLNEPRSVRLSNGMAWDENINKSYFIDSCDWDIKSFDYCPYTGDIWNEQVVYNYTDSGRRFDRVLKGITCDANGNLWVGLFGGSEVRKIDPRTGDVLETITFPCKQISGLCFSEKKYNVLYVTTSALTAYGPQSDVAGKVFRVSDLRTRSSALHKVRLHKHKH